ncbi:hypothetical protein E4O92_01280 [Massilia horti]|uniref:SWIM-type domain-containing protein n=2 Tax=Massilia horti TaxID=2562153 RepID=A0A4Y9T5K9_9BURK|nr:hypothetical protein E4O92_01280 [Massilia horti]
MDNRTTLLDLISPTALRALAGTKSFQLGKEYFNEGAVSNLTVSAGAVRAQVAGTESYRVVLRIDTGELSHHCSCPHAGAGYFCKHCVAVGFAWVASMEELPAQAESRAKKKRRDPWCEIQSYLCRQEAEVLIALVLNAARRDDSLYRSLLLKAERDMGGADLSKIYHKAIDDATRTGGLVAWNEVGPLLTTLDDVVDSLAELLQPATSGMLVELLEYAIERIETMLAEVDDSGGGFGEIVTRLGELHLEACRVSMPDPEVLAGRLLRLEMTLPFGIWNFDPFDYQEILGEKGLQRYRELALAKWRTIEPRTGRGDYDAARTAITRIMERLAEESGDVHQLVEIKSRDLSSAFHYLEIAELLGTAGEVKQALEWAERGLAAFPERTDNRLRDFLVSIYLQCGREDEALQLTWIQFEEHQSLENYKKLSRAAKETERWHAQRERALSVVDAAIAARAAEGYWGRRPAAPDFSLRVAIALWESDLDAAWRYANLGVCDRGLLVALAGKLEMKRLDDAIELYRRIVPVLLEQTNNAAYEEVIGLVKKMAGALSTHQRGDELAPYLEYLRVEFKRKRNFIKLLDRLAGA